MAGTELNTQPKLNTTFVARQTNISQNRIAGATARYVTSGVQKQKKRVCICSDILAVAKE